jgi:hypothetical protein
MGTPPRSPVIAGLVDTLLKVTAEYAAHFYYMYVEGHTGKHLTGDRIRILLLNLSFVFRHLIAPKAVSHSTRNHIMAYVMYDITSDFLFPVSVCCIAGSVCQRRHP